MVSDTNQIDTILGHFTLQILPVVTAPPVIILVIDGANNINGGEPSFGMLFIPNGADLTIVIEAYGFLRHNQKWQGTGLSYAAASYGKYSGSATAEG